MQLPPGTIIGEKQISRKEYVGIDDTITDKPTVILFVPKANPTVLQVYLKETGEKIAETLITELFQHCDPKFLAEAIKKLKGS